MLKRHSRFFLSLLLLHDVAMVMIAFAAAYLLRFSFPLLFPFDERAQLTDTRAFFFICTLVWPVCAQLAGLYRSRRTASVGDELYRVFRATLSVLVLVVLYAYFARGERYSRGTLLLFGVFCFLLVGSGRTVFRRLLRAARSRGYNLRHVLVVGSGPLAEKVVGQVHAHGELGLRVLGTVGDTPVGDAKHLGCAADFQRVLRDGGIDQVIIALPIDALGMLKTLMDQLSLETVDVRIVPDLYQFATLGHGIEEFGGLPMIALQDSPLYGWNSVLKRLFDVLVSLSVLLLFAPLYVAVAMLVKLTSAGAVFHLQERMGLDGRTFRMLKFRTMREGAEVAGHAQMTAPNDPRRTSIGTFLRRTSLDELPQFFNVLLGDMSVVGPRPERPSFIEDFKQQIPKYHLRHKMKAGITGWAQVHGLRGQTSIATRIEYDLYYIEHWSLFLDLKILVRTMFGGFLSRNAY